MGKTYLIQHVYEAEKGRRIKESGVSEEVAAEEIHSFIQGKRCLIVLDDVWRATKEGNLLTRLGIPTGANSQCKILVSTRSREVCVNLNAKIYEMEGLTDDKSWKLFCAYAFPESEGNRVPEYLEKVARDIEKECVKLPLPIKTTAASLASTTLPMDWHSRLNKLKKREGFIPAGENPWDCLEQLANLCLVEVWENDWYLKKFCKIHDLLLDLAILICRENKCAFSVEEAFAKLKSENTGGGPWCRLLLAKKEIDEHAISKRRPLSPTLVRALSLSSNTKIGSIPKMGLEGSQPPAWISQLRCLQHLEGPFVRMPKGISKLEALRTLRVEWSLSLSMEEDGVLRLEDVGKMSEIEEIAFEVSDESQLKRMEERILEPLVKMRRLKVENEIRGMQGKSESDLPQFSEK
ncbi:hypothetical protein SUGI_1112980 [Cryptomeria japonica]|nr:hypothetical protein SUGI_1112980 [Cryptomeria japonica]